MQELTFESTLALILAKDSRYHRDAYLFVKDALDHTQKIVVKESREQLRHVTGQELLEGIRSYALNQFGPMAEMVFAEWGVNRCEDFGEIVFNMVEIGLLGKTEEDSREDFQNGYSFHDAFRKPFLPSTRSRAAADVPKATEA
ncbi:MAG TPA: Minf_1886 family protein [Verrucomicrobiae bacterium]|nr:Minf_1886 family protein [Verrucomicrobiae bacterium]